VIATELSASDASAIVELNILLNTHTHTVVAKLVSIFVSLFFVGVAYDKVLFTVSSRLPRRGRFVFRFSVSRGC